MKNKKIILIVLFMAALPGGLVWASGVVARQKQMIEAKQKAASGQAASRETARPTPEGRESSSGSSPSRLARYEEKEMDIKELWQQLETSSVIWPDIIDAGAKIKTAEMYIKWYQKQGVVIRKSPEEYVQIIDSVAGDNPQILENPFRDLFKIVAIIEYDFDNGMNKDELARKVLGQAEYARNKARLGVK